MPVEPAATPLRQQYKAMTRQRLIDAAVAEFQDKGYAECTIEDVVRTAGTSRATFYKHFSGKAQLIQHLWDDTRQSLLVLYRDLAAQENRDREFLASWIERTFSYYESNRLKLVAVYEAATLERELTAAFQERIEELVRFILPAIRRQVDETAEGRRLRAALLLMQHERFCYFFILRGFHFDRDEAIETLAQLWSETLQVTRE